MYPCDMLILKSKFLHSKMFFTLKIHQCDMALRMDRAFRPGLDGWNFACRTLPHEWGQGTETAGSQSTLCITV